jgi:hypothetical protein
MADPSPVESTCPSCGKRAADDEVTGWCSECAEERAVDDYLERDRPIIDQRRAAWRGWSQSPGHARERQRRHRLFENTRPKERPHRDSDPLELCWEALEHLRMVRHGLKSNVVSRQHLDDAVELVKMLGWGPGPRTSP